ncbi:MAG: hypothetical protein IJT40_04220, partial [Firmicutes bacterium]|nr:hypothetical protein [Bacillota bacterium]
MKNILKRSAGIIVILAIVLVTSFAAAVPAYAAPTDEILNFVIMVDVNDDASLNMTYHIDWMVLDDSIGELEWIDLGVPNSYHTDITPLSDSIDYIEDNGNSLAIYLDRGYGEGEAVTVEFSMVQDHMYQIDKWVEGETVYTFTPAWFDGMDVDNLYILWNADKAGAWQPDCIQQDGYLVFYTSLSAGDSYTMTVVYPNDAYGFSIENQNNGGGNGGGGGGDSDFGIFEAIGGLIAGLIALAFTAAPFVLFYKFVKWIASGLGFGSNQKTEKKIVRTKIEYYDNCPSCGMAREEGKDSCQYCGRSMIKSKEVIEEKDIKNPEKYTKKGTYRYGDSGNTYINV